MSGMSKASVCRVVKGFVRAVNKVLLHEKVKFPENIRQVIEKFFDIGGFPMVCGVVDGTLINIDAPSEDEAMYVDRHGKHSINCMVVCGPDMEFYYSYANWPGSAHDGRVLRNSGLYHKMEREGWRPMEEAVLLGDSGYPLKDWLITPIILDPEERGNRRFLRSHRVTRRIVENSIGILKEKFPCLKILRVDPRYACQIFNCCVTLCNISKEENVEENNEDIERDDDEDGNEGDHVAGLDARGIDRLHRILEYFR